MIHFTQFSQRSLPISLLGLAWFFFRLGFLCRHRVTYSRFLLFSRPHVNTFRICCLLFFCVTALPFTSHSTHRTMT